MQRTDSLTTTVVQLALKKTKIVSSSRGCGLGGSCGRDRVALAALWVKTCVGVWWQQTLDGMVGAAAARQMWFLQAGMCSSSSSSRARPVPPANWRRSAKRRAPSGSSSRLSRNLFSNRTTSRQGSPPLSYSSSPDPLCLVHRHCSFYSLNFYSYHRIVY